MSHGLVEDVKPVILTQMYKSLCKKAEMLLLESKLWWEQRSICRTHLTARILYKRYQHCHCSFNCISPRMFSCPLFMKVVFCVSVDTAALCSNSSAPPFCSEHRSPDSLQTYFAEFLMFPWFLAMGMSLLITLATLSVLPGSLFSTLLRRDLKEFSLTEVGRMEMEKDEDVSQLHQVLSTLSKKTVIS